jgi:hypothetical protein
MKLLLHARASAETTSTDTSQTHALACSRPNRRTLGPEQRRGVRGSVRRCDQTSEHGRDRNVPDERTIPLASASLSGRSPKPPMRITRSRSAASRGSGEPGQLRPHSRARRGDSAGRLSGMVQDPKRPSSASVYPAGRNTGGNEVGTNRVRGWRLVVSSCHLENGLRAGNCPRTPAFRAARATAYGTEGQRFESSRARLRSSLQTGTFAEPTPRCRGGARAPQVPQTSHERSSVPSSATRSCSMS